MKVLFAVDNEKISESIIKKYQTMYKEIISCKNVYFFNAIIKELQKDKSYDRIVIGEDLETYANNNYDVIDNFLFDKLDGISDEASNTKEGDIPIILIATDRREKSNSILVKLFGIGIYNVLLGQDRSIENVCRLINQPRTKKEAKTYYKIEVDDVDYQSIDPDSVSEIEIQNIIRHYKKLGKNEDKYVESFDEIAQQYTDMQLKLITKFLPLNVRAVLEERSQKYQQVMIGSVKGQIIEQNNKTNKAITTRNIATNNNNKIDMIGNELKKSKLTKPVVIPSAIDMQNVKKAYANQEQIDTIKPIDEQEMEIQEINEQFDEILSTANTNNIVTAEQTEKKGRGRPKKQKVEEIKEIKTEKRGRGRPPKNTQQNQSDIRPTQLNETINLFNLDTNEDTQFESINAAKQQSDDQFIMPGLENGSNIQNNIEPLEENDIITMPGLEDSEETINDIYQMSLNKGVQPINAPEISDIYNNSNINMNSTINKIQPISQDKVEEISRLLTGDKKIVSFVGTSKNGTSFLVNNLAALLSSKGINTAILDLTKNKNAYYIYTLNEDNLRNKAFNCIDGLRSGVADGIQVNKNLTVYTTLPGENTSFDDYGNIIATLAKNYSLILLDCDFDTNVNYFEQSQEIYLVQTYDILTIQPLTEFLNQLSHKNILDQNKLRIVINKTLKLRKLTEKMIIGGISCYNDPASTFINTLFNKDTVRYTTIPFEDDTYARYLERLVDCQITLSGYSKGFLMALDKLANMVYPLISQKNNRYSQNKNYNNYNEPRNTFNNNTNDTLNRMRNNF